MLCPVRVTVVISSHRAMIILQQQSHECIGV